MTEPQMEPRLQRHSSERRLTVILLAAGLLVAGAFVALRWLEPGRESSGTQADGRLAPVEPEVGTPRDGRSASAPDAPQDPEEVWQRAHAAAQTEQWEAAVRLWDSIADPDARAADSRHLAGRILLQHLYRAAEAEARFRAAIRLAPDHLAALTELATLLGMQGRRWEAVPWIQELFRRGRMNPQHLVLLGTRFGAIGDANLVRKCREASPDDPTAMLAIAANPAVQIDVAEMRRLLEAALARDPKLIEAQVRLGTALLKQGTAAEFATWRRSLPVEAQTHPEFWMLLGEWARDHDQERAAMRCYWEAIRRDPNHRQALFHLAHLLQNFDQPERAAPFRDRHARLQAFQPISDALLNSDLSQNIKLMETASQQLEELGRVWEAWGWSVMGLQVDLKQAWARERGQRLLAVLADRPPLTLDSANPAQTIDLGDWPLPDVPVADSPVPPRQAPATQAQIVLADRSVECDLHFTYFNDGRPVAQGKRMFEFSGGGPGVLDYDNDGWPDLYFTQGCRWPAQDGQREHLDRLFRQVNNRVVDVTQFAGIVEDRYSQGMAIGDFDNDGFADIYVANLGRNRLFQNQGDGTFRDVSAALERDEQRWTTSCLLADLDGDGLPDLYDVNYLEAPDVYERICQHADGNPRMCMPFHFNESPNQFHRNRGDGRFEEATLASGLGAALGKGLGVVAADLHGAGQLSLFVANDTTPNFLWVNEAARGEPPRFVELGTASGLAYDEDGRAEGCMGIAAGDLDGDGRLDFFVGNFLAETNTLYLQESPGVFSDQTRVAGLAAPSWNFLAFGAQCLDGDLDGDLDLVLVNGHVDDLRAYGRPYAMRPQLFVNQGAGRFVEAAPEQAGEFFTREQLGRGVARLDFDRDGREEIAVSHLESPAALLRNTTPSEHHYLTVHLRGVRSGRDAIGATIIAKSEGRTSVRQLTAGDGYECSNQRVIVLGLGTALRVDELEIRWPAGGVSRLADLTVDREVLAIEDRPDELIELPPR